jgi:Zn-dependent protease
MGKKMKNSFVITRIWGIPVGLHFSWLLIFGLLMFSLATGILPEALPGISAAMVTALALVTSLLFFSSILAHELGHTYLAIRNNIPVRGITLFFLGGVAQIEKEPESAGAEFRIAAAGPLVSFVLAGLFFLLTLLGLPEWAVVPASWLARINLTLALFNLIPGFPLDGGRIFRAIVWKLTQNAYRATQVAAKTGQGVAFGFIGLGLFNMLSSGFMNGIWLAFIGWFLLNAASGSLAYASFQKRVQGLQVYQVMRREIPFVPASISLANLVQQYVLELGHRFMYVGDWATPQGVLSLDKIREIGQSRWAYTTTGQAMTPLQEIETVTPYTDVATALNLMERQQINHLPVFENERLLGIITRDDILARVELRSQLRI